MEGAGEEVGDRREGEEDHREGAGEGVGPEVHPHQAAGEEEVEQGPRKGAVLQLPPSQARQSSPSAQPLWKEKFTLELGLFCELGPTPCCRRATVWSLFVVGCSAAVAAGELSFPAAGASSLVSGACPVGVGGVVCLMPGRRYW